MTRYRLCGEIVECDFSLIRFPIDTSDEPAGLRICEGPLSLSGPGKRFAVAGSCRFEIDHDVIRLERLDGATDEDLVALIIGPILAIWLRRRRNWLCLHASSVQIGESAVLFAGDSGAGKSTLAATLLGQRMTLLGDDLAVIDVDRLTVVPSYAELRLWPDAMHSLDDVRPSSQIYPDLAKRAVHVDDSFGTGPVPLRALFFLEFGPRSEVSRCSTSDAIRGLVRHTRESQLFAVSPGEADMHLEQMQRLIEHVPMYRLARVRDLAEMPRVVEMVRAALLES
jgi:hypothetical protein